MVRAPGSPARNGRGRVSARAFVFLPTRARGARGAGGRARVAGDGEEGARGRRARMGRWFDGAGLRAYRRRELVQLAEGDASSSPASIHVGRVLGGLASSQREGRSARPRRPRRPVDVSSARVEREGGEAPCGAKTASRASAPPCTDEISQVTHAQRPDRPIRRDGWRASCVRSFRRPPPRARAEERTSERARPIARRERGGRGDRPPRLARALAPRRGCARGACRRRARGALLSRHHRRLRLGGGPDDRATARRGPAGRRHRGGGAARRRASPTPTPPLARASVPRARPPPPSHRRRR